MISRQFLYENYVSREMSVSRIARDLSCSENKVTYWLKKHNIPKRTISDAIYLKHNPKGDPFSFKLPMANEEFFLYGLGLGLFWGEGNKANTQSVRLGNSDPDLILFFLKFLNEVYQIDRSRLRFGLQIFKDVPKTVALNYWVDYLGVNKSQFQKVVITLSVRKGTYRKKCRYGVLTIYFSNTKLRDMIVGTIENLRYHSGQVLPS